MLLGADFDMRVTYYLFSRNVAKTQGMNFLSIFKPLRLERSGRETKQKPDLRFLPLLLSMKRFFTEGNKGNEGGMHGGLNQHDFRYENQWIRAGSKYRIIIRNGGKWKQNFRIFKISELRE